MSGPPSIDTLLARNANYNITFPKLSALPSLPAVLIISCADPRVIPEKFLNLDYGEAIVFRCIAGHPQTGFKDLLALDQLAKFKEVMVVHHTDCGSTYFTTEDVRRDVLGREGNSEGEFREVFGEDWWGPMEGVMEGKRSVEATVTEDVEWLKGQKMLRPELKTGVRGFVFHTESGKVTEVK